MKKNKVFVCGIVAGLIIAMSASAFGAPVSEKITAYINHQFSFEFDSAQKDLPEGYHVLVYEGRSYVPARFVAENLGATVDWDDATKMISIKSAPPLTVTVPAIESATPSAVSTPSAITPSEDSYNYRAMPQTKDFDGFRVSAISYGSEGQGTGDRLYLSITNDKDGPVQLDQMETKIIADGKTYEMQGKDAANFDVRWYSDILKDQTVEGYLRLPSAIKDAKKLHVELTVNYTRDFKTLTQIAEFNISL